MTSSYIFCLFTLESYCFFFCLQLDSLLLVCITWTQINIKIAKGNYNLQNLNICWRFPFILVTFTKKALQIFCAINECDSDYKKWSRFFAKTNGYQKNVWHKQECD
jgi:hypothetical protein